MRRFVHAAVAAIVLAAPVLIAAPAHAAPAASHWQVAIVSDLDPPVAGDTVELSAYLMSESGPIEGKPATLLIRTVGSGVPFTPVATVSTDADGAASTSVKLTRNTAYRWHYTGDSDYTASSTGTVVQAMASKVVAHGSDLTLSRGQVLAVFGKAYPNKSGNIVRLWMGRIPRLLVPADPPVLLAAGRVRSDGSFRLTRSFSSTGYKRLFIQVQGDGENSDGSSNYVVVKVG